jgi:tetratricopeptide (TPR) repeat protein
VAGRGAARKALGDVAWAVGDLETAAIELQEALRLGERSDDVLLRLHAMTALVGVNAGRDQHRDAARQLVEAQLLAASIGYRHVLAILGGNETELRRLEGQVGEALACGLDALGTFRALGDVSYLLLTHVANLASTLTLAGEMAGALTVFERLTSLARADLNPTLPSSLAAHADALARSGDPGRAVDLLVEAAEVAAELGDRGARVAIGVHQAVLTTSPRDLEAIADLARSPGEVAAVRWAAWRLDQRRERDRLAAAEAYARLHVDAPKLEYRERHVELTGRTLHDPPSLPPAPEAVAEPTAVVAAAMAALEARPAPA